MISMPLPGLFWTLIALQIAGLTFALILRMTEGSHVHRLVQRAFFVLFFVSGSCAICSFWWSETAGILHGVALAVMTVAAIFDTRMTRPGAEPTW
jgi:hypothetical protein